MSRHATLRLITGMVVTCLVAVPLSMVSSAQERTSKSVLIIHSGDEFFPSNPVIDAAIRKALISRDSIRVDHYAEYLEVAQFGTAQASAALFEYVRRKFQDRRIDLVIAITNESLQFVLDHRQLFPDAPIVFAGLAVPDESTRRSGQGIAALRVGSAYAQTLQLALDLHTSTRHVFVVAGSPSKANVDAVEAELNQFSRRVQLTYLNLDSLPRLEEAVKAAPPDSLILHIWQRQSEGMAIDPRDVARVVAEASAVPVYGTVDINIGTGMVGGVVRGIHETGTRVGEIALEVLEGRQPQDIPVEDAPLVPMFDDRQLTRWGISRSQLPPTSRILFATPSVWESYRGYIVATFVVVVAQLLAIAGLLVQRTRRRRAEETVLAREATIRTSYDRIRHLAGRLITAQETVRAGIARDLHDGICQELAGVSIALASLRKSHGTIQDGHATLDKISDEMLNMFDALRRLSHDLHPATLRLLGLGTALQSHCAEVEKRHGVQVRYTTEGDLQNIHPDVALSLFRIAQESLRNSVVHGNARELSVSLSRSNGHVDLMVKDDGRGFDLDAVRGAGGGLGLVSIEERAHMIDGHVQIVTGAGKGTAVHVRAPAPSRQINAV
jgi:signal transduction histidine kinase/ABC-type uncharacterized transport system substrate-binding protein